MARTPEATGQRRENREDAPTSKGPKDRQARKYGFACANCRKRKAKCDGNMPSCERCLASGETCYFNKAPSVAYSVALQNRLDACESLLQRLRLANDGERTRLLEDHFDNPGGEKVGKRKRPNNCTNVVEQENNSPITEGSSDNELVEVFNETSVDDHGRICFYGTTSLFHLQPDKNAKPAPLAVEAQDNGLTLGSEAFSYDAVSQWENSLTFDTPSPSLSTGAQPDIATFLNVNVDSKLCLELLETYWCWPHHLHLVLCRKLFMRDLMAEGPYVTPFLLNAVLAQAARYSDRPEAPQLGQIFAQKTLDTLAQEVDRGSSIPTIQGLLIFSARECACGRTSQGWLYTGMAFSMMRDMGIHIHPKKLMHLGGQFSAAELALRQQMFWSCYTWDKTMSLCLGRAPAMHDLIGSPTTNILLDGEDAENDTWKPKFSTMTDLGLGLAQKAYTNSRFVAYCHLCTIIDEVLANLYSKPQSPHTQLQSFFDQTLRKLETWANGLPPNLYVKHDSRSVACPPLHILVLNLLYHATLILLCRPYRFKHERARKMATTAAEMIDRLFMLHIRRFGFRVITYLESYTMFVASTINILDLKEGIDAESASARLALSLEILRNASSTPSNARCVEIIEQLMQKDQDKGDSELNLQRLETTVWNQPVSNQEHSQSPTGVQSTTSIQNPTAASLFSPTNGSSLNVDFNFMETPPNAAYSNIFDQPTLMSPTSLPMASDAQVETPMRWLADNMGTNTRPELWMMMDMDFNNVQTSAYHRES